MSQSPLSETVTTSTPCCLTGSTEAVVVAEQDRHGRPLRTVLSTASGLVYTDPRPNEEEVRRFYAEEYRRSYKQVETPKLKHVLRAARLAKERLVYLGGRVPPGGSVLDAGSGGGEFVYTLREAGYDAYGVEPNRGYAEFSVQQYGLRVFNGFYQDADFQPGQFDCVTMFHVLEHLEQPVAGLRLLSSWLRDGGTFVVEVPNVDDTDTAPGQKWHVGHLYNFSGATLQAAGMLAGLRPVRVERSGVLLCVFEKSATPVAPSEVAAVLEGEFERTRRVLADHTLARHYLRPQVPLMRLARKVYRELDERSVVQSYAGLGPAALIDHVIDRKAA